MEDDSKLVTDGKIGADNYKVKDCPFHLPQENLDIFNKMKADIVKNEKEFGFNKIGNCKKA